MSGARAIYITALAALALAVSLLVSSQDSKAHIFQPLPGTGTLIPETLGANADVRIPFDLGAPHSNFGGGAVLTFNDPAFVTSPVSLGASVAYLESSATLSILNNPCFSDVKVNFRMVEASIDNSAGNVAESVGSASQPTVNFTLDDGDIDQDTVVDDPTRADNGIADGAEWYPKFVDGIFQGIQPTHRYFGWQNVPGTPTRVILQIIMFDEGDLLNLSTLPSSELLTSVRGTPTAVILNDPTAPQPEGVDEFCTPLATITSLCGNTDTDPDNPNQEPPDCDTGLTAESGAECDEAATGVDDDGDNKVNDGCPAVGAPETTVIDCGNDDFDDDNDGKVNDGCPIDIGEAFVDCNNAVDDDVDGKVNDGCLIDHESGTQCANATDEDGDGAVNDGCPTAGTAESGGDCSGSGDEDGDGRVNDGCPNVGGSPESGAECLNAINDDPGDDSAVNDGCPVAGVAESGAECANATNDDPGDDSRVNDGCPIVGSAESGADCDNKTDDDGDGFVNDGCPATANPEIRGTNPTTAGTYGLNTVSFSLRDADNDGHENLLDPCPLTANPNWDPRGPSTQSGQDSDGDGLPDVCDTTGFNSDEDGDGFQNRRDSCAKVSNPDDTTPNKGQFDLDIVNLATPVPDGGPRSDNIGPECDPNPNATDGHYHINIAGGLICIGGTDNDGDEVCDGYPGEDDTTSDTDGDGVVDRFDNCIAHSNPRLTDLPQMTPDINGNGIVQINDVTNVSGRFGKSSGQDGFRSYADLANQNGVIQINDITAVAGAFGKTC